mmetsp:Transcript_24958/g.66414  ORF Transcript_24958/g.66414 Transcript_24958/m.66414 type:complete len:135 (+) Transcript_24958:185-589(+)
MFWVIVVMFEGHSPLQIGRDLRSDFAPTLCGDLALWLPIDVVNFSVVPVQYQVLVAAVGSLLEAVAVSYVHERGFFAGPIPANAAPSSPPATCPAKIARPPSPLPHVALRRTSSFQITDATADAWLNMDEDEPA